MSGRSQRAPGAPSGDGGNLVVLEAVLIAIIMLGSILFVLSYQAPTSDSSTVADDIAVQARDGLVVLDRQTTTEEAYNQNLLNKLVTEALHGDSAALEVKFGKFLPSGAGYSVHLDNGYALTDLVTTGNPLGEVVTGNLAFAPEWSYVFLTTDFAVYPDDTHGSVDLNVTGVPVHRSNNASEATVASLVPDDKVTVNFTTANGAYTGFQANLTDIGGAPGVVGNASIPAASATPGYPDSGTSGRVRSNWTHRGHTYVGSAKYQLSDALVVYNAHATARTGLDAATTLVTVRSAGEDAFAAGRDAGLGDTVAVTYDLTQLGDNLNASGHLTATGAFDAVVEVYAPVQGLAGEPTEWLLVERWAGLPSKGAITYDVPQSALYGTHVVVVGLNYTLDNGGSGINQTARLVDFFNVGLPGGQVPPNPIYRVVVAAWFDDW